MLGESLLRLDKKNRKAETPLELVRRGVRKTFYIWGALSTFPEEALRVAEALLCVLEHRGPTHHCTGIGVDLGRSCGSVVVCQLDKQKVPESTAWHLRLKGTGQQVM